LNQILSVTGLSALGDVGRGLEEAFFMFWETAWALVLGFGLSGAVQAFVSRQAMQAKLGDHRPASIVRASGYGMVSSSCSYAATAMAKSLVAKGADFVAAMVFMFASINLVVELGIVLVVLIGWQFAAAEFVGGAIMIVLLALAGALVLTGRRVEAPGPACPPPAATATTRRPRTCSTNHGHGACARGPAGRTRRATPWLISPCCAERCSSAT